MKLHHRRWLLVVWLAFGSSVSMGLSKVQAQAPEGLPQGLESLGPADYVTQAQALDAQGALVGQAKVAVRQQAKTLFDALNLETTQESYLTLLGLYELSRTEHDLRHSEANAPETKTDREAVLARQDNWTARPFADVRAKYWFLERLKASFDVRTAEVRAWVQAGGDVGTIPVGDIAIMRPAITDFQTLAGNGTVIWEGTLTAPQTGNYKFFISPINISDRFYTREKYDIQQTMTVTVGGQAVITATPENWTSESAQVALTANQGVPLRVEMTLESPELPPRTVHAVLQWEGPGIAKSVIPKEQLTPPGGGKGLKMTISWQENGQSQTVERIVQTIDQAWGERGLMVYENPTLHAQLNESLWQQGMAAEFLNQTETDGSLHPFLDEAETTIECLYLGRRKQFLQDVLNRPALLDPLAIKQAVDVYRSFRLGTPEEALDVFGLWAKRHADYESRIPDHSSYYDFDYHNRKAYRLMAICVAKQLPAHSDRLRDEFLELEDGSCSLPVAYVLAFSYLGRDRFEEWTALLDAKLADESLAGDNRVNWLLARAMAHELRLGRRNLYDGVKPRAMDGRGWIDEALIVVESDAVRARIAKELAARMVSVRRYAQAKQVLDTDAATDANTPEWKDAVDRFKAAALKQQEINADIARTAHLNRLKERRDRASAAGNTTAIERYQSAIDAFESEQ